MRSMQLNADRTPVRCGLGADALWVKKYMEGGLIEPFDLASISSSSELYSMAKKFDFLNDPKGALG